MKRLSSLFTALLLTLSLVSIVSGSAKAISSTTISSVSEGQIVDSDTLTIEGTYTGSVDANYVGAVLCTYVNDRCASYVENESGTISSSWQTLKPTMSPSSSTTGSYSATVKNLQAGSYKLSVYVYSDAEGKGPRAEVKFSMTGTSTTPDPDPNPTPDPDPSPDTDNNGYFTITWGRSDWQATSGKGCTVQPPNSRTMQQNAEDLAARGLYATGGVIINRVQDSERFCHRNFTLQPTWDDLALLRDTYGWHFHSQGMTYSDMTQMTTDEEMYQESAATIPILKEHGHLDAEGAFNFPANKTDDRTLAYVDQYFSFGRKYGPMINTKAEIQKAPHTMYTISVNGGRCNNPALPCYNMRVANDRRTASPLTVAKKLQPKKDEWRVVQYYRIVDGQYGKIGDGFAWDCTSSDWQDRWTSQPEISCRNNFLMAIDGRSPTAQVTYPAEMAQRWLTGTN